MRLFAVIVIPGAVLAECARDAGRKARRSPAASSVHSLSDVARGVAALLLRVRRDASPPSSGGSLLSSFSSFPLRVALPLGRRGCG